MDQYNRYGSTDDSTNEKEYQPNFILKNDTMPADASSSASADASADAGTPSPNDEMKYHDNSSSRIHGGSYRDPRENFRRSSGYEQINDRGYESHQEASKTSGASEMSSSLETSGSSTSSISDKTHPFQTSQDTSDTDFLHGQNREQADSGMSNSYETTGTWDNTRGLHTSQKKKKSSSGEVRLTRRSLAMIVVICLVLSTAFGIGGAALGNNIFSDTGGSTGKSGVAKSASYNLADATGSNMSVQEITEVAKKSVVEIKTEGVTSDNWMQQYVTEGAGSGVVISSDGYIMTNNHVIDGAGKITVTTADGKEFDAKLIGSDDITDVAVLKIDAKNLTSATYGNSDQLTVGDLAVAIGNPLGELGGTVTAGIISALDRQVVIDGKSMSLLQTDTSINPGNSGGGLFNGDGQLIGLVVAKSSGSDVEGLGFAIPVNKAADVAQQIIDNGYVSGQPSTGMSYVEASGQQNSFDSLFGGEQSSKNVYIYSVEGENAKAAGFQKGDMVQAIDGEVISSFNQLSAIITAHSVGDKLKYTVVRDGRQMNINLTLEEKTMTQ